MMGNSVDIVDILGELEVEVGYLIVIYGADVFERRLRLKYIGQGGESKVEAKTGENCHRYKWRMRGRRVEVTCIGMRRRR